jgi:hypothetical protein
VRFFKHSLLYIVYDYISRLTSAADTQLTLKLFNDGILTSELTYVEKDKALIGGDNLEVAATGGRDLEHYP